MKNAHFIDLLSKYDGNSDVIIDGATDFIIDEVGPTDDRIILILKK